MTGPAEYRVWGQANGKIRPEHRDRLAVVYVRQSNRQQVLEHTESTRLQYALHNPIYAGYYAYGRRRVDPRRKALGRPSTGRVVRDRDEWPGWPRTPRPGCFRHDRRARV